MPILNSSRVTSTRVTRSASKRNSVVPAPQNTERFKRTTQRRSNSLVPSSEDDSASAESKKTLKTEKPRQLVPVHVILSSDSEDEEKLTSKVQMCRLKCAFKKITVPDKHRQSVHDYSDSGELSLVTQKLNKGENTVKNSVDIRDKLKHLVDSDDEETITSQNCNHTLKEIQNVRVISQENSLVKLNKTPRKKKAEDFENNEAVTPPKLHKKQDSDNKLFSPSSLFAKLDLNGSPMKNLQDGMYFEPKQLFEQQASSNFQSARKALHSTVPVQMPGREKEHSQLRCFIKGHLDNGTSGTLYVSGPPGTGKTASLSTILRQPDIQTEFKEVYVNCTAIKSSGAIYARIVKELGLKCSGKTEKDYVSTIETHLQRNHTMILLVLDEIDQLESKKQSILYTIFEWPSWPNSRLILIGIANALDLTDRILPRLQARCELKPKLMHFAPYTKQQIVAIFTDRLKEAGVLQLFSPVALQMLAGKVAAISGDVRRALDIGRRVVEIVEQTKLQESKCVDLKHVIGVLNSVYGTSNNLNEDGEDTFPLQQKIIICTLVLILRKARNKDVTIGKLHEVYKKVCDKRNILAVDQAEFVGLCSLIETKGILRVSGRKEPRLNKVNLEWDDEEVSAALKDKQLMSMILQDDSVLGKM